MTSFKPKIWFIDGLRSSDPGAPGPPILFSRVGRFGLLEASEELGFVLVEKNDVRTGEDFGGPFWDVTGATLVILHLNNCEADEFYNARPPSTPFLLFSGGIDTEDWWKAASNSDPYTLVLDRIPATHRFRTFLREWSGNSFEFRSTLWADFARAADRFLHRFLRHFSAFHLLVQGFLAVEGLNRDPPDPWWWHKAGGPELSQRQPEQLDDQEPSEEATWPDWFEVASDDLTFLFSGASDPLSFYHKHLFEISGRRRPEIMKSLFEFPQGDSGRSLFELLPRSKFGGLLRLGLVTYLALSSPTDSRGSEPPVPEAPTLELFRQAHETLLQLGNELCD